MRPIYLDNHATTPLDRRALDAMMPYLTEKFGNAASRTHAYGWETEEAVKVAREHVAALISATPEEIVFTSGATESINLALKGIFHQPPASDSLPHLITLATEHKAVLDTCRRLEQDGFAKVTLLSPQPDGRLDLADLEAAFTPETKLVAVMTANNEIGVVQPIEKIGERCRSKNIFFFTDAAQAAGKIPLDVESMHIDMLSLSAHKMYGPKGVGALYVRRRHPRVRLHALIDGGGHERGFRSGTLNVAGIAGFGKAAELALQALPDESARTARLRDKLLNAILERVPEVFINGSLTHRLPNNLNLSFAGIDSEALIMAMNRIAVSTGSACSSAAIEPSHVLKAIGVSDDLAYASVRFGLGRFTTDGDIDIAIEEVSNAVKRLRELTKANTAIPS